MLITSLPSAVALLASWIPARRARASISWWHGGTNSSRSQLLQASHCVVLVVIDNAKAVLAAATILMTSVAVDTVVHVLVYAPMIGICLRFQMAIRALEHRIVIRIGVAGGTDTVGAAVIHREVRVIEGRPRPCRGRVARRTGRREPGRCVVRIRRAAVGRLVARVAIRRHGRVVVVHVTIGADNGRVRTRQRERRVVVVEGGVGPNRRAVAQVARLRETGRRMVWIGGCVVVIKVAGNARRAVNL